MNTDLLNEAGDHDATTEVPVVVEENETTTITNEDIPGYIAKLVKDMSSSDSILNPALLKKRADKDMVEESVNNFSLKKGPAEVAAFYDFNSLQIAFDHVWKQLIDESLITKAQKANKGLKEKVGVGLDTFMPGLNEQDYEAASDDLLTIIEIPKEVAANFDITREEYSELNETMRSHLDTLASNIESEIIQLPLDTTSNYLALNLQKHINELRGQAERIIDSVRNDDYYSLHETLRELHQQIKTNYEFTVFAADKNFHSVNFGLMNTYRQQWTPVNYQAGKLIKTMALSPDEVRNYSWKITKTEKRSIKEAQKNNSSITSEQTATTRIQAEIIAKATSKTNFSLATEGTYDIFVSSGSANTTFGMDATHDSSETRTDFHEAVVKAVQDYKEERSSEIDTQDDSSFESNESGTIKNPNNELSVTYLFYELQQKYQVSEQLFRVRPVVLVAQEVPAPDHITDAWVIAHDWIINRNLLDDSFRSTLQYLSSKSIGDDFALRELRKNLRQQRSLVESLTIELAIASREANNRYHALENLINKRIKEEHDERNDGFALDFLNFWGKDGPDPEAAKARELAAKDAHQYAIEKNEKMSATLKEEMNNLQTLTNEYIKTLRNHLDNEARIKRLLVHIRNNIFYYMQAIWSMEPPDQRFLRLHKVQVPVLEFGEMEFPEGSGTLDSKFYFVDPNVEDDIFRAFRKEEVTDGTIQYRDKHHARLKGIVKHVTQFRALVEIADLDKLLGYKGNYMIFPLKEHNALTELMAAPYIDNAFGAMDPDELSNVSLNDYSKYVCCLHEKLTEAEFLAIKPQLKAWLEKLLADPLRNGDEIVIPTNSLFIESLPGVHPLLEDFKLKHRELDVQNAAEDLRTKQLEDLRRVSLLLSNDFDDPKIDKRIVIEGREDVNVNAEN